MISRDRSDNITALLRWTSDASSAFRSMGLVPIIPSHGRDVIIGLARNNLEFCDLFGRADSCRLAHKAWIERRLRPQLPLHGIDHFRAPDELAGALEPCVQKLLTLPFNAML